MAANFEIIKNNFVGFFEPANCSDAKFRPWIQFVNEHSIVRDSLSLNAPLKVDFLRLVCTCSVISAEFVTFIVGSVSVSALETILLCFWDTLFYYLKRLCSIDCSLRIYYIFIYCDINVRVINVLGI